MSFHAEQLTSAHTGGPQDFYDRPVAEVAGWLPSIEPTNVSKSTSATVFGAGLRSSRGASIFALGAVNDERLGGGPVGVDDHGAFGKGRCKQVEFAGVVVDGLLGASHRGYPPSSVQLYKLRIVRGEGWCSVWASRIRLWFGPRERV